MSSPNKNQARWSARRLTRLWATISVVLIVSLACNLPFSKKKTEPLQPTQTQVSATEDLPPTIIETNPLPHSVLERQGDIELVFDQPMERSSVEGAISLYPAYSGGFEWVDDTRISFRPDQPLPADTTLTITVSDTARGQNGMRLLHTQQFNYQTAGDLEIAEYFPANGLNQVDPASSVAVTFNQPVVPLGDTSAALPAFSIQPEVEGIGKWLNSSTYLFEPKVSLGGGVSYTVRVDPLLTSLAGSPLAEGEDLDWSFQTSRPEVMWVGVDSNTKIWLEPEIPIQFNQAMDHESVEANVKLTDTAGKAFPLKFTWEEYDTRVTLTPLSILPRATSFSLTVEKNVKSNGGNKLGNDYYYYCQTLTSLEIISTQPEPGQEIHTFQGYGAISFYFNAPLAKGQKLEEMITISPQPVDTAIRDSVSYDGNWVYISGFFQASQDYTVTISGDLIDKWGGKLGNEYSKIVHVADLESGFSIPMIGAANRVLFLLPGENAIQGIATNISRLDIRSGSQSIQEMIRYYEDHEEKLIFTPDQSWTQTIVASQNSSQTVDVGLTSGDTALQTGIYHYYISSPQLTSRWQQPNFWVIVSKIQLTMKTSKGQVFVWATDLQKNSPVTGKQITVYDNLSNIIGSAVTDSSGIATIDYIPGEKYNNILIAVMGEPGSPDFSAGFNFWRYGIQTYDYGLSTAGYLPDLDIYGYTDRPIYRPGQTVYFRGVLRQQADARYIMTDVQNVTVEVYGDYNNEIDQRPLITTLQLPVSRYGTINSEFILPEDAAPGDYIIQLKDNNYGLSSFKVSEYRKPQIDLKVNFDQAEYKQGSDIRVNIDANYFFGAAAAGSRVVWTLYAGSDYFSLPEGYTTGPLDLTWMQAWHWGRYEPMGNWVTNGEGTTDDTGRLTITFKPDQLADALKDVGEVTLTLQATLVDQSEMVLSQRGSAKLHPADFYIGIRPDNWGQPAGALLGYSVQTTDWNKQPSGEHLLNATFQKVTWKMDEPKLSMGDPQYTKELTPVSGSTFKTDASGLARIEFTPKDPGTYQLEISGDGALTQLLVWVGGSGSAVWPRLPNQHLRIEADKQLYEPGESAEIFIPNPFVNGALALVTVERANVLRSWVVQIDGPSQTVDIPMSAEDAPNVYVSVMLLGKAEDGRSDFRLGFVEVGVNPEFLKLQVDLIPETDKLAPGETARAQLRVRDFKGNPVKGEFSLAVVDAAIYALAAPNARDILEAYYGKQLLRVETSTSLVAYSERMMIEQPAMGGGGGGGVPEPVQAVRKNYRDTAYWSATIETDENGIAQIEFPVPDNLTTWVMTARGLTTDTLVGETTVNIVVSKDLLVQPVTPRFMVVGDRVQLGAVVHNNTDKAFEVKVGLQAKGVQFEDENASEQTLQMASHSNQRINWWVNVSNAGKAELIFSASGGGLQDSASPELGDLPILHYSSPMSFATNGVMTEGGETLEVVSLPKSFTPTGGQLSVEMSSTLAGTVLSGLDAMKSFPSDFTEPILSNLSANLAVYEVLQVEGVDSPYLEGQLKDEIRSSLDRLFIIQNTDGGWGWCPGQKSDFYLSAYAFLVVSRAKKANFIVDETATDTAQGYVATAMYPPTNRNKDWELDRLAFAGYALKSSGYLLMPTGPLYELRARLSPWAQALLAMSMGESDSDKIKQLLSDLQSTAIRSSTGANWEDKNDIWYNHASANTTTAIVLLALAEKDPASELLTEATRFLALHRRFNGGWDSSFDTSWAIQALARLLEVTGDLRGNFTFAASVNNAPLATGQASGMENLNPVNASIGIENLDANRGNALRFQREEGPGRLYYRAFLQLDAPVEAALAADKGITISRRYSRTGVDCSTETCPPITSIALGQFPPVVQVQLSITVPNDMYDVVVEDFIPAGAEIVDTELLSSQRGIPQYSGFEAEPVSLFNGWGWWYFGDPIIYNDHIHWVTRSLPAGTYILTYDLQTMQAGEFRILPAHAYSYYFPDVEGRSQGEIFTITN